MARVQSFEVGLNELLNSYKVRSFHAKICHKQTTFHSEESQKIFCSKEEPTIKQYQERQCKQQQQQQKLQIRFFQCIHRTIFLHLAIILLLQPVGLLAFQSRSQTIENNKANYEHLPSQSTNSDTGTGHEHRNHNHGLQTHHHQLLHPRRTQFNPQTAHQESIDNMHWMKNITASIGRNATFECRFPDLRKDFKLAWFHLQHHTLLALHDSVIVKNGRVSVRSHANTTFYLTIHDIRESDTGVYMCQVNTIPMRKQFAYLEVSVPPTFVEKYTSSDVTVREGSSVSLSCVAKGRPEPEITWRREDNEPIVLEYPIQHQQQQQLDKDKKHSPKGNRSRHNNNNKTKVQSSSSSSSSSSLMTIKGNQLNITVSHRTQTGAFLCIASNGIPSPIAKRIFLGVIFAPIVRSRKESVGVYIGTSVTIDCNIESYPRPSIYWQKDERMPPIIHSDHQYEIDLLDDKVPYKFILRLKILNFTKDDVGKYTCVGKNTAGEDDASLRLYKLERPTQKPAIQKAKSLFLDLFASSQQETTTSKPIRNDITTKRSSILTTTTKSKNGFSLLENQYGPLEEDDDDDENSDLDYANQYISPGRERIARKWNRTRMNSASRMGLFKYHLFNLLFIQFITSILSFLTVFVLFS